MYFLSLIKTMFQKPVSYNSLFRDYCEFDAKTNLTELLHGIFINSSYESNKRKCSEAFLENILIDESVDMLSTVNRLRDIGSCTMLPIKEIESSATGLCSIKCEDFDVKVEVENTGPFPFFLSDDVYVMPPIPNPDVNMDLLKIDISSSQSFLKPLLIPRFEIVNMYEDFMKSYQEDDPKYSSLLFKTFNGIDQEIQKLFLSGCQFTPVGYVVAKSGHEPPSIRPVKIEPHHKFVLKIVKPNIVPWPDFIKVFNL